MKHRFFKIAVSVAFAFVILTGCKDSPVVTEQDTEDNFGEATEEKLYTDNNEESEEEEMNSFLITVGDTSIEASFADNGSAEAFKEKLQEGPLTLALYDYGNFEKVGALGFELPRNDTQITTEPGDVILYQGNQITIYYDTNSWNFTRLGKIQNVTQNELKEFLGEGDVSVTFSLK